MLTQTLVLALIPCGWNTVRMNKESAPWGAPQFEREQNWYQHLKASPDSFDTKQDYQQLRQQALADPNVDLFDSWMPTKQPKRDVGAYVRSQGIRVPLITSMEEWQEAFDEGGAMLRSESTLDYTGASGMLSSSRIKYFLHDDEKYFWRFRSDEAVKAGPVNATLDMSARRYYSSYDTDRTIEYDHAHRKQFLHGLREGIVAPGNVMEDVAWQRDRNQLYEGNYMGYPISVPTHATASRWRYIPGINLKVFRDPVIEGKYYIGSGEAAHHTWEVTEGVNSPPIEAHDKGGWRRGPTPETFEYELPAGEIVTFYEKIRTLPYFDQRQTPLMEFQYDKHGKLHFLQYLKTGHHIADAGEFSLPTGRDVATSSHVRGATSPKGEQLRVYIDPEQYTPHLKEHAFFAVYNMARGYGGALQAASMLAKVAIMYALSFKDNHFDDAPLFRPPVAVGLWDGVGELDERMHGLLSQIPRQHAGDRVEHLHYIDAKITSNGRQAAVASDWELKKDVL